MINELFRRNSLDEYGYLVQCGNYVNVIECKSCETRHFAGFSRCKIRWCLNCMRIKRLCWIKRIMEIVDEGKYNYHALTLTHKDMEELNKMLRVLGWCWRQLVHERKEYRKRFKSRFKGGVRSLEVKKGKGSGLWHLHYHLLLVTGKEFQKDYDWMKDAWKDVTSGNGSVEIHKVKEKDGMGIVKAVAETIKYIIKPENSLFQDENAFIEAYWGLKNVRQVNTFGIMRGIAKEVEKEVDKWEERKLIEFICQKCGCREGELLTLMKDIIEREVLYDIGKEED